MKRCQAVLQNRLWCAGDASRGSELQVDEDGDLCLERTTWKIRHFRETTLDDVGGQIWRGSCSLSDFILSHSELFEGKRVLELGCGIGLVGIALHGIAQTVYLTDHNVSALELCQKNIDRNAASHDGFKIRILDWTCPNKVFTEQEDIQRAEASAFQWGAEDLEALKSVDVFLAADVIYDPPLTAAFFQTLARLMRHSQKPSICYLSLEKRFNFTLEDLDVASPAYSHFRSFVDLHTDGPSQKEFAGEKLPLESIPQILDVPRSKDMELWKIELSDMDDPPSNLP